MYRPPPFLFFKIFDSHFLRFINNIFRNMIWHFLGSWSVAILAQGPSLVLSSFAAPSLVPCAGSNGLVTAAVARPAIAHGRRDD